MELKECHASEDAVEGYASATVRDVSDSPSELSVELEMPHLTPDEAYQRLTDPAELRRWWAQEAETDPRVDGAYLLSWPTMGRPLRGRYTAADPGRALAFTWAWHQEPDVPERLASIVLTPTDDGGTHLGLAHGTYGDGPVEAEDREGHLEGWRHFLPRLAGTDNEAG